MDNLNTLKAVSRKYERLSYRLYRLVWLALDWLYPPECGGCGGHYSRWCEKCQIQIHPLSGLICERCGGIDPFPGKCDCVSRQLPYEAMRSWARYQGPIRNAIRRLKYNGDIALGEILARPMIQLYQEYNWQVDMIVPVPVSLARKKMRGYNQAAYLALPIALSAGLAYCPNALIKVRDTRTQVGLSPIERRQNVKGAFLGQKELVDGKKVLVVDDVTTSGATMEACASALLDQGASQVYGLTLARTILDNPISF